MVLQSRLDYGFNGYRVPHTPRATRSARRRDLCRKKANDNQMRAFDLLATVAGKLLLEGESSPSSTITLTGKELCTIVKDPIKKEQQDEDKPSKVVDPCGQRSCDRSCSVSKLISQSPVLHHCLKELSPAHKDSCCGLGSVILSSDCSEKVGSTEKLANGKSKVQLGGFAGKVTAASSGYRESCDCKLEYECKKQFKMEPQKTGNASISTKVDICGSDDRAVRDRKSPALVSLDNSMKLPLCTDDIPSASLPARQDDVKLVVRDDAENSYGCTHPSTAKKAFRPPSFIGNQRTGKFMASKYWQVTPKLKDEEYFSAEIKPVFEDRKVWHKCQRSQRDYPLKKRKFYDHRMVSNSDGGISSEGIASSPGKGFNCDASGSSETKNGACGRSAPVAAQHAPFHSRDSHVKLKIKSFKVPELFIEIPESATVGSLKRTVLEAVTAILEGGLRVGVILQGKKIGDDNKTLLQTGISHDNKLDALGFSLEPNPSQAPLLCREEHPFQLNCDTPQPLARYPPAPSEVHNVVQWRTTDALPDHTMANLGNFVESDHDSAPSPPDMLVDKSPVNSKALVAVPAMKVDALAVVPMRKPKRAEAVQRRIRRPFSVSEVEALVQAVEKLGTGRWRDVKLRAFDNAKHRTYVDLKDKWKTLVHTARISPQQRRGEPVPQELLDRVLNAHAYWSQRQAKQQFKQQSGTSPRSLL